MVFRSPWRSGLQVAAERMYSGHRTIGLQVTTGWRFPGGHRMRAYMSPHGGDLRYLSSNPKPRLGTRCSALTPSLGSRVGSKMSGIETWPVREIQQPVKNNKIKNRSFTVFKEVAETSFLVRQCSSSANSSTRKSSLKREAVLAQGLRDLKVIVSEHIEITQRFYF